LRHHPGGQVNRNPAQVPVLLEHLTHCANKWSKLDTVLQGVSVDTLLKGIETSAEYVTQYSDGGYTTNLPRAPLLTLQQHAREDRQE